MYFKGNKINIFNKFISVVIISIILICFISISVFFKTNNKNSDNDCIQNFNPVNISNNNISQNKKIKKISNAQHQNISYELYSDVDAFLTIPILNVYNAPICEGTSQNVMKNYIGHFSNTSYDIGNIGLASHNRDSSGTYFKDLYKLKENDYILYTYKNITRRYVVDKIIVIDSFDWSYLEKTIQNKLTLITCISNKPNYRLCIQALQI